MPGTFCSKTGPDPILLAMREFIKNRPVFAWALYDWANSAFATTVMAGLLSGVLPEVLEHRRGFHRDHVAPRICQRGRGSRHRAARAGARRDRRSRRAPQAVPARLDVVRRRRHRRAVLRRAGRVVRRRRAVRARHHGLQRRRRVQRFAAARRREARTSSTAFRHSAIRSAISAAACCSSSMC